MILMVLFSFKLIFNWLFFTSVFNKKYFLLNTELKQQNHHISLQLVIDTVSKLIQNHINVIWMSKSAK